MGTEVFCEDLKRLLVETPNSHMHTEYGVRNTECRADKWSSKLLLLLIR